ncbi:MAG: peptidase M16 [Desulfobacteraceae bacterium]|nr:peptidase M16 [Desulfobacteraceae bacterium]
MTTTIDPLNKQLCLGDQIHGYQLQKISPLDDIRAVLYQLEHLPTGSRHLHISCQDQENVFAVTFKTVPADSTGVAHILEHTALCGSAKYPVRDPFFSMIKRSLSTFMNAFTSSDWTMYPFATQNKKDFYQLMDVYLDAAFFPILDELSFKQEGHRLEFEPEDDTDKGLTFKGVVYNEMKGAMSSADQIMSRSLLKAIYPETTYANNSGGDPNHIPDLTREQLKAFHRRHYHPSNAYFFSYGSFGLEEHLEFINQKVLSRFQRIDPKTKVPVHPRWKEPKTARFTYPVSTKDSTSSKSQVALAWLACDVQDTFEVLTLAVLEQILLGNAGSPLRKALMDSGMGSALSDATGYVADNRDTMFACGLKDTDSSRADEIEALIIDCLSKLAEQGIDTELIQSAIHQIEFHRKEITNTPYPYGIRLNLTITGNWLHGGDPGRILKLDADLIRLQQKLQKGPFLEQRIRHYFLDNPHRLKIILEPDQHKSEKDEKRVHEKLQSLRKKLTPDDIKKIKQDTQRLKALQESQEDISCLPTLALSDIPPEIQTCSYSRIESGLPVWTFIQPTSGIYYFKGVAGVGSVPRRLLDWIPFYCYVFNQIGTKRHDYPTMARRIDAATGGFRMNPQVRTFYRSKDDCIPMVSINCKCLTRNMAPMLDILEELIAEANFMDQERLKQLLGEYHAGLVSAIVHNGHRLAISRSAHTFNQVNAMAEIWSGIRQIKTIGDTIKHLNDNTLNQLAKDLSSLSKILFEPNNVCIASVGDQDQTSTALNIIQSGNTLSSFNGGRTVPQMPQMQIDLDTTLSHEGWSTSSSVAFVAKTLPTVCIGHPDAPVLAVLARVLRSKYLHREIREKGGAYGGFALYNPETGLFSMASYRDPHILRTLDVYSTILDYMKNQPANDDDIKEAVLQVCSEIDKPDTPAISAQKAFTRLIIGLDDDVRQTFKEQLLHVDKKRMFEVGRHYFHKADANSGVAVIADENRLVEANTQTGSKKFKLGQI